MRRHAVRRTVITMSWRVAIKASRDARIDVCSHARLLIAGFIRTPTGETGAAHALGDALRHVGRKARFPAATPAMALVRHHVLPPMASNTCLQVRD